MNFIPIEEAALVVFGSIRPRSCVPDHLPQQFEVDAIVVGQVNSDPEFLQLVDAIDCVRKHE